MNRAELELQMMATARRRPGWERLENIAKILDMAGNRVLDIGIHGDIWPGGHKYMFKNATYETLDIDPNVQPTYVGDIRHTNFPDSIFDMVILHSVLEHIMDGREKVYPEIIRILSPEGIAVLVIPSTLERESEASRMVTYREVCDTLFSLGAEYSMDKLSDGNWFVEISK